MSEYSVNLTDTFTDALKKNCPSKIKGSFTGIVSSLRNIEDSELQKYLSSDVKAAGIELYTIPVEEQASYEFLAGKISSAFVLIYIGSSDEVRKWRTGHRIIWNSEIQELQISKTFRLEGIAPEPQAPAPKPEPAPAEVPAPAEATAEEPKSDLLKNLSDDELAKLGVPGDQFALVRSIDCLAALQKHEEFFADGVFERLRDIITESDTAENIIFEIRQSLVKDGDITSQISENPQTRRHICSCNDPVIDAFFSSNDAENFDKWTAFLHPSQTKYVTRSFKGPFKLTGGAGTGKTVVALHRMKWLAGKYDKNKILYLTFSKGLSANISVLQNKIRCYSSRCENMRINALLVQLGKDYHLIDSNTAILYDAKDRKKLMNEAMSRERFSLGKTASFLLDEYDQVILAGGIASVNDYFKARRTGRGSDRLTRLDKAEIWRVIEKYNDMKTNRNCVDPLELYALVTEKLEEVSDGMKPYQHVIVDEFQDLGNTELKFIRALVPKGENDIFLVGDPYQKIYSGTRINFSKCGIDIRGQSRQLKINYRTTDEIRDKAVSVVKTLRIDDGNDGVESLKGYFSVMHGDRPRYMFYRTEEEEYSHIVETMKELLASDDYRRWALCVTTPFKNAVPVITEALKNMGIEVDPDDRKKGNGIKPGQVYVKTMHEVKGLEFGAVLISGISSYKMGYSRNLGPEEQQQEAEMFRSLVYVALTRAVRFAEITGHGYKPYEGFEVYKE